MSVCECTWPKALSCLDSVMSHSQQQTARTCAATLATAAKTCMQTHAGRGGRDRQKEREKGGGLAVRAGGGEREPERPGRARSAACEAEADPTTDAASTAGDLGVGIRWKKVCEEPSDLRPPPAGLAACGGVGGGWMGMGMGMGMGMVMWVWVCQSVPDATRMRLLETVLVWVCTCCSAGALTHSLL